MRPKPARSATAAGTGPTVPAGLAWTITVPAGATTYAGVGAAAAAGAGAAVTGAVAGAGAVRCGWLEHPARTASAIVERMKGSLVIGQSPVGPYVPTQSRPAPCADTLKKRKKLKPLRA